MITEFRRMFLLVNAVAGLLSVSGTEITTKYACPGDNVQAFQNIEFDRCNAFVSLNINGVRNTPIATWSVQNCTLNATLLKDYKDRVFLNQNGTITIHNLHHFDQAKYVVISKKDTLPSIQEVQIYVMVAPSKDCKPTIVRLGNKLLASLKAEDCGKPVATPYWKGYGGVTDTNEPMLKLTQGQESGTYYACIEGPALGCSKTLTSQEYCSAFTIEGSNSANITSETCNTAAFIVVNIVLAILFVLAIAVILILIRKIRRRNLNGEQTVRLLKIPRSGTKQFDNVNGEHTVPLPKLSQQWKKQFDILKWENIKQLLNDNQQEGLQAYCDNLKSLCDEQEQSLEIRCEETAPQLATHQAANSKSTQSPEPEHEIEESRTEHQPGTDPEKIRELQELRDTAMCKICFGSKMSVCFMPCKHMATCAKCSIPLNMCPICRATVKEKMNIRFE